jgi:hypothetical protein
MTEQIGRRIALAVTLAAAVAAPGRLAAQSFAQSQPFLFTTLPLSGEARAATITTLDAGYAERSFAAVAPERLEMRAGLQSALSPRFSLLANAGVVPGGEDSGAAVGAEVMMDVLGRHPGALGVGVGGGRDYDGTGVAMAHMVAARRGSDWQVAGNVRFEHPFNPDRDAMDLLTSLGYEHRLGAGAAVGVEGVGEDLEGLFETDEAEGGAKLMLGPTLSLAAPRSRWLLLLGGGPILYINRNSRTSPAVRDLNTDAGFALRLSVRHH